MFNIAQNTFREILRSRYFPLIFLFGLILIVGIFFFNEISLHQKNFIVPDFGLSFLEIIGVFLILFLGNRLLSREFEEKTIYLTLSRPIPRGQIIFGKFLGFSLILAIAVGFLSMILVGLMMFFSVPLTPIFFLSILGIFFKLLILLAIALFLSIFLSGSIATFGVLATYIIAHSGYTMLEYGILNENIFFEKIAAAILMIFPNFVALNFKSQIHLNLPLDFSHIGIIFLFAILYLMILLFLSKYIFEKKSFDNI